MLNLVSLEVIFTSSTTEALHWALGIEREVLVATLKQKEKEDGHTDKDGASQDLRDT